MATLIVDDEASTRQVLRELVEALGFGPILEAKNGSEARQIIEREKARIELIISDYEMPEKDGLAFLADVAALSALDHAPFLLVTSADIEAPKGRLDGILRKPFQLANLRKALLGASAARAAFHSQAICFGGSILDPVREKIRDARASMRSRQWKVAIDVARDESLEKACETHLDKLGILFIEAAWMNPESLRWLSQFKKSHHGTRIQAVCVSENRESALAARIGPDQFIVGRTSALEWETILSQLESRAQSGLVQEIHQKEYRLRLQAKDFSGAQSEAEALLKLDPRNSDYTMWVAKCLDSRGDKKGALESCQRALELNPFNIPAIHATAKLLRESGDVDAYQTLAARALKIDPKLKLQ